MPLDVVKSRDPKGLYAKVAQGLIKGFTGIDAPYEPPLAPELTLKTHELTIEQSVAALMKTLGQAGVLVGEEVSHGLHAADGGVDVNLIVPAEQLPIKLAEAATLPKVPLTDYDINWLQVMRLPISPPYLAHISPISRPHLPIS